jgi:hypothetical protein
MHVGPAPGSAGQGVRSPRLPVPPPPLAKKPAKAQAEPVVLPARLVLRACLLFGHAP